MMTWTATTLTINPVIECYRLVKGRHPSTATMTLFCVSSRYSIVPCGSTIKQRLLFHCAPVKSPRMDDSMAFPREVVLLPNLLPFVDLVRRDISHS